MFSESSLNSWSHLTTLYSQTCLKFLKLFCVSSPFTEDKATPKEFYLALEEDYDLAPSSTFSRVTIASRV
jgi:hypothetical protein